MEETNTVGELPRNELGVSISFPKERTLKDFVREAVDSVNVNVSHIRSSGALRDIFNQVVLSIAESGVIRSWGLYCMNARLDALQKLTIDQLTIPAYMTALGVGVESLSSSFLSILAPTSSNPKGSSLDERIRCLLVDIFVLLLRTEDLLLHKGEY